MAGGIRYLVERLDAVLRAAPFRCRGASPPGDELAYAWGRRDGDGNVLIASWAAEDGSLSIGYDDVVRIAYRLRFEPDTVLRALTEAGGEYLDPH